MDDLGDVGGHLFDVAWLTREAVLAEGDEVFDSDCAKAADDRNAERGGDDGAAVGIKASGMDKGVGSAYEGLKIGEFKPW